MKGAGRMLVDDEYEALPLWPDPLSAPRLA